MTLTLYSKPSGCVQCNATKKWLDDRGIPYQVVNLADISPSLSDTFRGWGYSTAPVAILTDARGRTIARWQGFDPVEMAKRFATPLPPPPPAVSLFDEEE